MIILKLLSKLIKVLRAGPSPAQVAGGFTLGMFLGMMPGFNFYWLLIFMFILLLNVNISGVILGYLVFSLFAYLFDPVAHNLGFILLTDIEWLKGFWTTLYNLPVFPLSGYNNTVVLGSLTVSLLLTTPVYFFARSGIILYREKLDPKFQKFKLIKIIKGSKIYTFYVRVRNLGD